jgi:hypothetical protein
MERGFAYRIGAKQESKAQTRTWIKFQRELTNVAGFYLDPGQELAVTSPTS